MLSIFNGKKQSTTSLMKLLRQNTEVGKIYVEMGAVNGAHIWGRRKSREMKVNSGIIWVDGEKPLAQP